MEVYLVKLGSWNMEIRPVEAEKTTEKTVWINGRARRKRTDFECYFDTREEAKDFLVERYEKKLDQAKKSLKKAEDNLEKAKSL